MATECGEVEVIQVVAVFEEFGEWVDLLAGRDSGSRFRAMAQISESRYGAPDFCEGFRYGPPASSSIVIVAGERLRANPREREAAAEGDPSPSRPLEGTDG